MHPTSTERAGETPETGKEDEFIKNNFLSNELRIPITLTGTYSGRAMATNATAEGRQRNRRVEMVVSGEIIGTQVGPIRTPPLPN